MQTSYKIQTSECRLGLKGRLRPKLLHRLSPDIVSIRDLYIGNKKNEIETILWKKPKLGIL